MTIARDSASLESLAYFRRVGQAIVAPATAVGGPVAVLRVSGKDLSFLEKFLGNFPKANSFSYRELKSGGVVDRALLLYFKAPHSFTGEDVVEIQCHGVTSLIEKIQSELVALGAEKALPGEFSFRAVLNNKMTLTDAEALQTALSVDGISSGWASKLLAIDPKNHEMVEARCEAAVQMVRSARGRVEAAIDFPEATEEQSKDLQDAEKKLLSVKSALSELLTSYYQFSKTAGEPRVAIVGAPNVGKSTLLNALLGSERSIVSQVAGTTRDVVEVRVKLPSGRWIRLLDTAGLRADASSDDSAAHFVIEKRGMELGLEAAEFANLVIWVSDSRVAKPVAGEFLDQGAPIGGVSGADSRARGDLPDEGLERLKAAMARKKLLVELYSHADLSSLKAKNAYNFNGLSDSERLEVLSELDFLLQREQVEALSTNDFDLVISRRQGQLLELVEVEVDRALSALKGEKPIELCGEFLREAETLLCRMTAKGMGEAYIEEIFRQFCLGK